MPAVLSRAQAQRVALFPDDLLAQYSGNIRLRQFRRPITSALSFAAFEALLSNSNLSIQTLCDELKVDHDVFKKLVFASVDPASLQISQSESGRMQAAVQRWAASKTRPAPRDALVPRAVSLAHVSTRLLSSLIARLQSVCKRLVANPAEADFTCSSASDPRVLCTVPKVACAVTSSYDFKTFTRQGFIEETKPSGRMCS